MTALVRVFVTRTKFNLMGLRAIEGFGIDLNEKLYGAKSVVTERPYEANVTEVNRKSKAVRTFPLKIAIVVFPTHEDGFYQLLKKTKRQGKGEASGFSSTTVESKVYGIYNRDCKTTGGMITIHEAANLNIGTTTSAEEKRANPTSTRAREPTSHLSYAAVVAGATRLRSAVNFLKGEVQSGAK
ncbi:hypothetical protein AAVH_15452 [Aphelenchoides avenae]|nr:hypothetical protein AAVH_15452 [Aphelenchus avenae]